MTVFTIVPVFVFGIVIFSGNAKKIIIVIDGINKRMNNTIDTRWIRRSYSSINGGAVDCGELLDTENKYIKASSSKNTDRLEELRASQNILQYLLYF
jgi:hypothetical protein